MRARRLRELYRRLLDAHGRQGWWPLASKAGHRGFDEHGYHPGNYLLPRTGQHRFEVAIGAVLTQNTAWSNVERAMARLAAAGIRTPAEVLACSRSRLEGLVKPSGYYTAKARKIREMAEFFQALPPRRPPGREELLGIWGVGEETADSILLYAFHQPFFVVDTYTRRLLSRLGLAQGNEPYAALQLAIQEALEPDHEVYNEFHALIVLEGKLGRVLRAKVGPRSPGRAPALAPGG